MTWRISRTTATISVRCYDRITVFLFLLLFLQLFLWRFSFFKYEFDSDLLMDSSDSQREIIALYERFCQLDRTGKGFISADEFMGVPEFAVNPLCQVCIWYDLFLMFPISNFYRLDLQNETYFVLHQHIYNEAPTKVGLKIRYPLV